MTIQEAIKSGKPFKRTAGWLWIVNDSDGYFGFVEMQDMIVNFTAEDILATDWEVKE